MSRVDPGRCGLAVGVAVGGMHAMWAALVASGWAQPLLDGLFRLHFVEPAYTLLPFRPGTAALLVGVSSASGWLFGSLLGAAWNAAEP